ncbi:hypothetical protein GUJ93_ZPchr0007g5059 [Zizania palustris]|uniref:Uncharacterized protein n=1 Tax=Zizania palustris TaxID=103762 RepID=A0A8J5TCS6_ZIZPA|nr:hypothetical protein GUJ93_ZPchr0007g5059 [Zizania palustris]
MPRATALRGRCRGAAAGKMTLDGRADSCSPDRRHPDSTTATESTCLVCAAYNDANSGVYESALALQWSIGRMLSRCVAVGKGEHGELQKAASGFSKEQKHG